MWQLVHSPLPANRLAPDSALPANSTEFGETSEPVVGLMTEWVRENILEQRAAGGDLGGTMRLGAQRILLEPDSMVADIYGSTEIHERHRHRYEFNPKFRSRFDESDFVCSGESPDGRLVEFIELPTHPFWVGTQAHPEFKSRPDRPAPLFAAFMRAALDRREGRNPQLIDLDRPTDTRV